jgi:diaminopimelate epimerase
MIDFVKMHGAGNDFIVVRAAALQPYTGAHFAELVRGLCAPHVGIGADGVLAYETHGAARLRMHYWNADGSRAEMCGNGARCIVRLAFERGETGAEIELETDAGARPARVLSETGGPRVEIDMGIPAWDPADVPVNAAAPVLDQEVQAGATRLRISAVSIGNPHAVAFVESRRAFTELDLSELGPALSQHAMFPQQANASFVHVDADALHVRTWERGSGPTLACGTASCAAFASARRLGRLHAAAVDVQVPGGRVRVRADDREHLWLCGRADYVAEGRVAEELIGELTHAGRARTP